MSDKGDLGNGERMWVCWRESRVDPGQICRHDRCGWAFVYPDDRVSDHRPITMRVLKEEN